MTRGRILAASALFLLILTLSAFGVQQLVTAKGSQYQAIEGLYDETPGSLDGVYLGSSNVHAFWQGPLAFKDHGIAVFSYSVASMPASGIKYLMVEARKTQPDALYIINLNTFKQADTTYQIIHKLADHMHPSLNRINMINDLADDAKIPLIDRMEFHFPIIRYHSRWSQLTAGDYATRSNGMKMALRYNDYYKKTVNISKDYHVSSTASTPTKTQQEVLEDLLAYIEQEKVRVLFVTVPQALAQDELERINALAQTVKQRGYTHLDVLNEYADVGLQLDCDFYNLNHTNVHGSIKYTEYLSHYLIDTYGFTDKRGKEGWESWDAAGKKYTGVISPYTLPFERKHAPRDYALAAPKLSAASAKSLSASFSWQATQGADGYEVYRKTSADNKGYWTKLGEVGSGTLQYTDAKLAAGTTYTYTVVPYRIVDGARNYGNFDWTGVSAKTAAK